MELFWAAAFAILGMLGSATLVFSSDRPITWSITSFYLLTVSATMVGITMVLQLATR